MTTVLPLAGPTIDQTPTPALTRRERRAHTTPTPAPVVAARPRKPFFFPAIDGLRGLAIASVLLYHTNWSPRGLFGVDVFFVVSGFLITLLLMRELADTGAVKLGRFFIRRAKRLIPGLLIVLGLTLLAVWQFGTLQQLEAVATKTLYSLLQIANWQQLNSGDAYWEATGQIQPLAHMWSLSLTEQFYIVWPFLLLALWWLTRRSALALTIALSLLTAGAALVAPLLWDGTNSDRLYLGTDSRAVGFIAGAAAAAAVYWYLARKQQSTPATPTLLTRLAVTAVSITTLTGVIAASIVTTSYHEPWLYQGGFAAVAILTAVFTATLTSPANALTKFFSFSLFTAFGKVSYTVYLLHLPIYWALQSLTPDIDPLLLFVVGGGLTWIAAAFLHYAITERMRRARWRWSRGMPVLAAATAAVIALGITLPDLRATQAQSTTFHADAAADLDLTPGAAGGRPIVLTLGDSLATDFATALTDHGSGAFAVFDGGIGGCGIMSPEQVRSSDGYIWEEQAHCHGWEERWQKKITDTQPDFIVVHTSWDAAAQLINGTWLTPGTPAYDDRYRERLQNIATWAAQSAPHATVLLATDRPTNGIVTDATQMNAFNTLLRTFTDTTPNTALLDLEAALCTSGECRTVDDTGNDLYLPDNVHLTTDGMTALAPWLEQTLATAQKDDE